MPDFTFLEYLLLLLGGISGILGFVFLAVYLSGNMSALRKSVGFTNVLYGVPLLLVSYWLFSLVF